MASGAIGVAALLALTLTWPTQLAAASDKSTQTRSIQLAVLPQSPLQVVTQTESIPSQVISPADTLSATATVVSQLAASPQLTQSQTVSPTVSDESSVNANDSAQQSPGTLPTATPASIAPSITTTPNAELEGTVITNRTDVESQFFVEGQTYSLGPENSVSIQLPRTTALLNLYNCAAVSDTSCFWDPYLLQRDGFYEIYTGADVAGEPLLLLRQAGSPPEDQVWVQNRTGVQESVVYRNEVHEVAPASVLELPAAADLPVILYVRSCISANDQNVCEWSPKSLEAGVYYAMLLSETAGAVEGSTMVNVDLQPILSQSGGETITASPQLVCRLQVPALNIRSGPGLQFQITGKVRSDVEPGSVVVVGRNPAADWLAVDNQIVEGGWVTSNTSFILCDGDVGSLPIVEVTDGRLASVAAAAPATLQAADAPEIVQEPAQAAPEPDAGADTTADAESGAPPAVDPATIPEGQSLLIVNNGFQYDIRFTLDQIYRVVEGPSEYDLQPGDSVTLQVYPGHVAFTASSPWNGLSGNADLTMEEQQSLTLWLRFEPDPDGSSQWNLAWN